MKLAIACVLAVSTTAFAGGRKTPAPKPAPAPAPAPVVVTPPPPPPPTEPVVEKEWSKGVPQAVQDQANKLYEEGNTLFAQQQHAPALDKYKQAVALWDHPLIRFNLAVTEIRLDRVLEAAEDLERALRYGDKPFKPELYQQALDYETLVKGRVGFVEASCDQADTKMLLDGKPWFSCPGTQKLRVLAGEHAIVGEREGFLTSSRRIVVAGGKTASEKVTLVPLDSAVILTYPYRRWIPWTTVGIGFAVGLAGAGTWFLGKNQMTQFNADFAVQCANGCEHDLTDPSHSLLRQERDGAELKGKIGIAMMAVGGAATITGIVLAIINRPTRTLPTVEVAPRSGGMTASVGWQF